MDRYEDFDAWKLAHALNMKVWEMTSRPPAVNDFKFRDNIRDAADSAERNFPEGFGRFGPKEFARFLDHSKASLLETKNELRVGLLRGYFSEDHAQRPTRGGFANSIFAKATSDLSRQPTLRRNRRPRTPHEPRNPNEPRNPGTEEPTNRYNQSFTIREGG